MRIDKKYCYPTTPKANEKAIVKGDKYRFTILTSRLIRIEYNENGYFEDRATQVVINRDFEVPKFTVQETDTTIKITTEHVELDYVKGPFTPQTLTLNYTGKNRNVLAGAHTTTWYYNTTNTSTWSAAFPGTRRTLDFTDGENKLDAKGQVEGKTTLEPSIMSGAAVTIIDDSKTPVLCEDGWVEPRTNIGVDHYLFCYGDSETWWSFKDCLKDFYKLTGNTPLLPRYAMGNWWSRYYAYTQDEYLGLMKRFKDEDIPFSVAVIDMDWHYVKIDPKHGSGWTGYTWNKELFPDHVQMLKQLHDEGLKVTLNLHPQQGVGAHEKAYKDMAEAMDFDTSNEDNIPFEIENPKFIENYFTHLHHPLEKEGVDFWWMDWQQGNTSKVAGLDPLWMLNHFHYIDNCKNGNRGLMFSRYAGPGSHRYPTGFSGDTIMSWASLKFQPYFTLCASNIGYGWWSHDIGGHLWGIRDEELVTRWYQFGVFSPINRLHSANSRFQGKEPWKYNKISELSMKKFLKLRHELIPYLYTMNYRASAQGEPIVQPLYYNYHAVESYTTKNEYWFGSEMLVAPITDPHDNETIMGSTDVFLPKGDWYDFFLGTKYTGDRMVKMYRYLSDMPVMVKAGGIVPMAKLSHVNDIENPKDMKIKVFAGADNSFNMYEDDGVSDKYKSGAFATTLMSLKWGKKATFVIEKPVGDSSVMVTDRNFDVEFIGINDANSITVTQDGKAVPFTKNYKDGALTVSVSGINGKLEIVLGDVSEYKPDVIEKLYSIIERFNIPTPTKDEIELVLSTNNSAERIIAKLMQLNISKNVLSAISEIIYAEC